MSPPTTLQVSDAVPRAVLHALVDGAPPKIGKPRTLGQAALAWSLTAYEQRNPPTPEEVAGWFAAAERDGVRLGLTEGDSCAVGACAAAFKTCGSHCDLVPHGYRASAKELMADAESIGAFLPIATVLNDGARPNVGDLAIYDRAFADRPDTEWFGHVDRVISVDDDGYENIGSNEAPRNGWAIEWSSYRNERLLGFVLYPQERVFGLGPAGWMLIGGGLAVATVVVAKKKRWIT